MAKGKYQEWLEPDGLLRLEAYARDGLTDEQIAKNIGINRLTLAEWRNRFPNIATSLKRGKEAVDVEVENALHKRAMGYSYVEVTQERVPIKDSEGNIVGYEITKEKYITKEVAPDVTAQIFWLKNRKTKEWRDKQDLEVTGKDGKDFEIKLVGV